MNNSPIKTVYCDQSSGFSYTVYASSIEFHKDGLKFCTLPSGWFKNVKQFEEAAYDLLTVFSSVYREAKGNETGPLVIQHSCNGDF